MADSTPTRAPVRATTSTARALLAAALAASGTVAAACSQGDLGRGVQTATTSGSRPRPDTTASTSRTIDNAGFVDNAGRTSDMNARTETSGMRATEAGSERMTGTPGSGWSAPTTSRAPTTIGEGAGAATSVRGTTGPAPSGGPPDEAISRLARARCDRETACNHVGTGRTWGSQEQCVVEQREHAVTDVAAMACPRGIDSIQLAICLEQTRGQACDDPRVAVSAMPECASSALCAL